MEVKKRTRLSIVLLVLLLFTSCWDTAFWEGDETITFTSKLVKIETQRMNIVGEKYTKLTFANGETYAVRDVPEGQLEVGKTYLIRMTRKYKLWSLEVYEESEEVE